MIIETLEIQKIKENYIRNSIISLTDPNICMKIMMHDNKKPNIEKRH